MPVMDAAALNAFLAREFPQAGGAYVVDDVADMTLTMRLTPTQQHLRPGGTVSGPVMFALADIAFYAAVLAMVGPKALTVTTNCSIDFMRKPAMGADLICTARILKLGRVLAVGDALILSEGQPGPVARASLTYSIPPKG